MGKDNCEPVDREKDGLVEEVNSHKWRKGGWGIISCMWDLQFGLFTIRDRKDKASSILLFGLQIKNFAEFFNGLIFLGLIKFFKLLENMHFILVIYDFPHRFLTDVESIIVNIDFLEPMLT